jgi:hypothetical protein
LSAHRNLTASQEARRRARPHELARPERSPRTAVESSTFGEGVTAGEFALALWRELDEARPGGLTCLDVARVAVERWGDSVEPALWRASFELMGARLLRQVGTRVVRDRGQVANLPVFVPAERWHE